VHPKWGTPHVSLIVQALCCVVFVLMGQMGSTVHGAYEMLISMTIVTTFMPYLFMFAALIRLQQQPADVGVVRIPGGKPAAIGIGILGFVATIAVIIGSVIPDASEPDKGLAVAKILLLSVVLVGGGAVMYWIGKRRANGASLLTSGSI
jgi:amino acid transporter